MSNEITVQFGIVINADNLQKQYNRNYTIDMTGRNGPSPGSVLVTSSGVNVDLSKLATPGMAILTNLDQAVSVEYGIYDTVHSQFLPLGLLKPGWCIPVYFSPNLGEDYYNTGTGTTAKIHNFRLKGIDGSAVVTVECYDA